MTQSTLQPRWVLPAMLLVLLAAAALRLAAITLMPHQPDSDETAYLTMAQALLRGEQIADHMGNRAMYNVGYPMFVIAPAQWLLGESLRAVQLANVLLGCVAVLLCYAVARACGAGALGGVLAAAAWALYLPASVYASYALKEALMIPLMLGATWCCLRVLQRPSLWLAGLAGLCFGLLALVGNAGLVLLGVAAAALLMAPVDGRQRLVLLVTGVLTLALVCTPWMARNKMVLGTALLNTNGGFNLYLGNNPAATGLFVSISDTPLGPAWPQLRQRGEVQASATLRAEALRWIAEDPARFARLAVRKGLLFWSPPTHAGKGPTSSAERILRGAWLGQFVVLLGLALLGLALLGLALLGLRWRSARRREALLLWGGMALYTAVHMVFYVIFRYREPIMPLVCVLAALTVEQLISRHRLPAGT